MSPGIGVSIVRRGCPHSDYPRVAPATRQAGIPVPPACPFWAIASLGAERRDLDTAGAAPRAFPVWTTGEAETGLCGALARALSAEL